MTAIEGEEKDGGIMSLIAGPMTRTEPEGPTTTTVALKTDLLVELTEEELTRTISKLMSMRGTMGGKISRTIDESEEKREIRGTRSTVEEGRATSEMGIEIGTETFMKGLEIGVQLLAQKKQSNRGYSIHTKFNTKS